MSRVVPVSFRCDATATFTHLHSVKIVLHAIMVISMLQLLQNVVVRLVYSKNPISALLQGRTFGSGCVWVKLVWNQGLPHTKPQWRPLRREKKGKTSPWPHQCLISKPVFNNSIMIFPQLEKKALRRCTVDRCPGPLCVSHRASQSTITLSALSHPRESQGI